MKNLVEIPQDAETAILILKFNQRIMWCCPTQPPKDDDTALAMILGTFAHMLSFCSEERKEQLRDMLATMPLEDIISELTE